MTGFGFSHSLGRQPPTTFSNTALQSLERVRAKRPRSDQSGGAHIVREEDSGLHGSELKELRQKRLRLRQDKFGAVVGVRRTTVSYWRAAR